CHAGASEGQSGANDDEEQQQPREEVAESNGHVGHENGDAHEKPESGETNADTIDASSKLDGNDSLPNESKHDQTFMSPTLGFDVPGAGPNLEPQPNNTSNNNDDDDDCDDNSPSPRKSTVPSHSSSFY